MFKNTASQVIGAQMVSATDGSAFTGTVSCAITKDGGTQAAAAGSVTHEGNGFHTLAATQADTNADHLAFTFTGTGAIPVTIQVYTQDKVAADNLNAAAKGIVLGTVTSGATTTSIPTSSLNPTATATDQFKGRIVIFRSDTTTTNLRGQATDITASTSGGTLTVSALSHAPASGDVFVIV